MKKTILIFGISSFVGSNLLEGLRDHFRVIGTYHKTPVSIPGITCIPCDVLKKDYVTRLTARFNPDFTIYAVGLSSMKECHIFPKISDALNSVGAVNCCVASERCNSKFIFLSSGFVHAGTQTTYKEGETPFSTTVYGSSLASTEFYVQRSCLNYLIFRCSPLYGRSYNSKHSTWFEYLQAALAKGEPINADDSVVTGFLDIQIMTKIIKIILDENVTNRLLHVSSSDYMSRYEFAKLYAKIFKKDQSLIQRVSGIFPVDKNKSTENLSNYSFRLDSSNLEEILSTKIPTIEESLTVTHKRLSRIGLS